MEENPFASFAFGDGSLSASCAVSQSQSDAAKVQKRPREIARPKAPRKAPRDGGSKGNGQAKKTEGGKKALEEDSSSSSSSSPEFHFPELEEIVKQQKEKEEEDGAPAKWIDTFKILIQHRNSVRSTVDDFHDFLLSLPARQDAPFMALVGSLLSVQCRDSVAIEAAHRLMDWRGKVAEKAGSGGKGKPPKSSNSGGAATAPREHEVESRDELSPMCDEGEERSFSLSTAALMSIEDIENEIRSVNYYKGKAQKIKDCAKAILAPPFCGTMPKTFKGLVSLPGVGPKIANLLLSVALPANAAKETETAAKAISSRSIANIMARKGLQPKTAVEVEGDDEEEVEAREGEDGGPERSVSGDGERVAMGGSVGVRAAELSSSSSSHHRLLEAGGGEREENKGGRSEIQGANVSSSEFDDMDFGGIVVDTHMFRVVGRIGWTDAKAQKSPEATRAALEKWMPKSLWREAPRVLIGFGQTVCRSSHPLCNDCPVGEKGLCPSRFAWHRQNNNSSSSSSSSKAGDNSSSRRNSGVREEQEEVVGEGGGAQELSVRGSPHGPGGRVSVISLSSSSSVAAGGTSKGNSRQKADPRDHGVSSRLPESDNTDEPKEAGEEQCQYRPRFSVEGVGEIPDGSSKRGGLNFEEKGDGDEEVEGGQEAVALSPSSARVSKREQSLVEEMQGRSQGGQQCARIDGSEAATSEEERLSHSQRKKRKVAVGEESSSQTEADGGLLHIKLPLDTHCALQCDDAAGPSNALIASAPPHAHSDSSSQALGSSKPAERPITEERSEVQSACGRANAGLQSSEEPGIVIIDLD
uniref:HhH-GPD domain-containing protein n=1 Tax=Chromera velia CCMP2878 TaxID=1169474 RepID=A0A0G4HUC7_9ALVE|eukprot:Cvel_8615.t1-p1 / transcript=Cvel_8615.t1 / gene=Cvel_8615 / organism=Chromera_velia_CCMP2878 / gene_product=Endonuclease III-like protein 1, putative / transcript_product=Endonuclease III-like protein 1, putative / location=Cvel_scaffold479:63047-68595(-) / protein_length=810 / sequence_SO=supercontig / SO=protein_coding / is_pseudo=false